ncbi:response regulator [Clostridium sp. CX1]|uniref:response regulator n=1 Tax=Clostridium sp. CX1 TaxID=2978346 RepID=UPI0021BE5003|nr:response regulator [Clostridium sp. CX1]MCT8977588.1 response regulator [Clostridium sp. CX1]
MLSESNENNGELNLSNYNFNYEDIFELLPYPIAMLDRVNNICKLNGRAKDTFDILSLEENLEDIMVKFSRQENKENLSSENVFEKNITTKIGIRHFEIRITPILDTNNLLQGNIIMLNDLTERKLLEDRLRKEKNDAESNNLNRSKFLINVSHEIRTAISGIIGMTDLTLMTALNSEQKENLNLVKMSSSRLLNIVNSIMEFSKIQLEKVKIENIEFNFKDLITEIVKVKSQKALEHKLDFKFSLDDTIPETLTGDPGKIKQVLDNLIDNAIEFTKEGMVSLAIEKEDSIGDKVNLKISVKDTGIGIDKKDIPKIFKNIGQIHQKNYIKKNKGTGLGLSICKGLVELMGGKIEVKSKKDVGTTFTFSIALVKGKRFNSINIVDRNSGTGKKKRKLSILVVEDDKASQMVMYNLLKKYGHTCDVANNGQEAVEMAQNKKYDLVLMDIQMPIMDGIQATKLIRKSEENKDKHIPIIALTAYALKGDREKLIDAGMDDYISKPFNVEELLKTVYNMVKDDGNNNILISNTKINNIDGSPLLLYLL